MLNIEKTIEKLGLQLYKDRGDQIYYWCPICGDHPNHTHAHFNINRDTGCWHCFRCSSGGNTIESLCKKLNKEGVVADDNYVITKTIEKKEYKPITLSDKAVRYYFDTLTFKPIEDKNFKIETLMKMDVKYDDDLKYNVFMLCKPNGEACGYSIRTSKGYLHNPEGIKIGELLYGYHLVKDATVYVVEGQTDTLRLVEAGYPAVGVLGNHISDDQVELLRRFKKIVLIPDNDDTLLRRRNVGLLGSAGKLIHFAKVFYVIPEKKDIESYPTEDVKSILSNEKPLSMIYSEVIRTTFSP